LTINVVNDLQETDSVAVANELRPILMKLARELRREVHSLGITGGQASLLFQIRTRKGVTARELAELERMSPAAMSGYIDRLEKAGLVSRLPDERDRRRQLLALTDEGERVLRSVKSRRTAWLAERLKRLGPGELEAVERALPSLALLLGDE
jgi:DNA-binding MarR family transcriptional regulator